MGRCWTFNRWRFAYRLGKDSKDDKTSCFSKVSCNLTRSLTVWERRGWHLDLNNLEQCVPLTQGGRTLNNSSEKQTAAGLAVYFKLLPAKSTQIKPSKLKLHQGSIPDGSNYSHFTDSFWFSYPLRSVAASYQSLQVKKQSSENKQLFSHRNQVHQFVGFTSFLPFFLASSKFPICYSLTEGESVKKQDGRTQIRFANYTLQIRGLSWEHVSSRLPFHLKKKMSFLLPFPFSLCCHQY